MPTVALVDAYLSIFDMAYNLGSLAGAPTLTVTVGV